MLPCCYKTWLLLSLLLCWAWMPSAMFAQQMTAQSPVIFTAKDFSFSGPTSIPGGWQTIKLVNEGHDFHQIQFLKLPPGKTAIDFQEAMSRNHWRQLPQWIQRHGGVNSVSPGAEAVVVINLIPGEYVLICGIPDMRGRPHVVQGMISSLLVKPSSTPPSAPSADVIITGTDFSYVVDGTLKPGPRIFQFRNDGEQAHEVVFVKLQSGASTQNFLNAYRPGIASNPAGKTIGGMVGLDPGLDSYIQVDLEVGRYGLLCFLGDPVTGAPHFSRGMWIDLDVQSAQETGP